MKVKLHLGCGKRWISGFTNIDVKRFSHVDIVGSADCLPFNDNSVDMIYTCHLLEHFKRERVEDVLREWHRVLRQKGLLRISVPDFEKLVEVYLKYRDMKLLIKGLLHGDQKNPEAVHYISFDYSYLSELLAKTGFRNIRRWDWRKTLHKNYDDYSQAYIPHMDKEHGIPVSLNVEAEKWSQDTILS